MTLPDARALLPDVQTAMADPQDAAARLQKCAYWLQRYTPWIGEDTPLETSDGLTYYGLLWILAAARIYSAANGRCLKIWRQGWRLIATGAASPCAPPLPAALARPGGWRGLPE